MSRDEFVRSFLASLLNDYVPDGGFEPEDLADEALELIEMLTLYPEQLSLRVG